MSECTSFALTILLVEDDAKVRRVLTQLLVSLGHTVLPVSGGREGLAKLEAGEAVDLVLTDLRMPEMSGWEFLQTVKSRWPRVCVGVITGTPQVLAERRVPLDLVITKPATFAELRDALSRLRR